MIDYLASKNVQQLTSSAILLLSPFLNTSLNPSINYPFVKMSVEPYMLPETVYNFAGPVQLDHRKLNLIEQFATNLIANTHDLEPDLARVLNEDFWHLYESQ